MTERKTRLCPDCDGSGRGCGCLECRGTDHGRKKPGECFLCYGTGIWFRDPTYREIKKHCCRKRRKQVKHFGMYGVSVCRYTRDPLVTVDLGIVTCRKCMVWVKEHREEGDLDQVFIEQVDHFRHIRSKRYGQLV